MKSALARVASLWRLPGWFPEIAAIRSSRIRNPVGLLALAGLVGIVAGLRHDVFYVATRAVEHYPPGTVAGYSPGRGRPATGPWPGCRRRIHRCDYGSCCWSPRRADSGGRFWYSLWLPRRRDTAPTPSSPPPQRREIPCSPCPAKSRAPPTRTVPEPDSVPPATAVEHRPAGKDDRRHVDGRRAHQAGRHGLVAARRQHHAVERIAVQHFDQAR